MTVFGRLHMPSLGGATEWLNSEPLGPAELRGHVVVNFWTLTCINWLRQERYVRAWSQAYRDDGLVVIGSYAGVLLRARGFGGFVCGEVVADGLGQVVGDRDQEDGEPWEDKDSDEPCNYSALA